MADLRSEYHVDGEALWRERRWRHMLVDLIDELPATSRTRRAMLQDPRVAEEVLAREADTGPGQEAPWEPDLTDWSLTNQLLVQAVERLDALRETTVAAAGKKPRPSRPIPRPSTAIDEARASQRERRDLSLLRAFVPHAFA